MRKVVRGMSGCTEEMKGRVDEGETEGRKERLGDGKTWGQEDLETAP
jgi:hypothetical protein